MEAADGSPLEAEALDGDSASVELSLTVRNKNGLHARPSSVLAETALRYESTTLTLRRPDTGAEVDAKSIMELLLLEAGPGTELTLHAEGPQAHAAAEAIRTLFEREFDLSL